MNKTNRKAWRTRLSQRSRILFVGFKNMMYSVLIAFLLFGAGCGFYTVPRYSGYVSVARFIVSLIVLIIGVVKLYALGVNKKAASERKCGE